MSLVDKNVWSAHLLRVCHPLHFRIQTKEGKKKAFLLQLFVYVSMPLADKGKKNPSDRDKDQLCLRHLGLT